MVQYSFSLQGKCFHDNKGELDQWLPPVCSYSDPVASILYIANSVVQYSFSLQGKYLHDNKGELDQWLPPVCVIAILLLIYCILQTAWSITHSLNNESVSMTIKVSLINGYRQFAVIAILLPVYCILLTAWSSTHSLYKESVSMTIKVSLINDYRQSVLLRSCY